MDNMKNAQMAGNITLDHGSGGKLMQKLIEDMFFSKMDNDILRKGSDSAVVEVALERIAFTTDSFIVKPLFFPGGDIGKLAVSGTVNDLCVSGALPQYVSSSFIIEEGFDMKKLERIVDSMATWARKAHVQIVTGDTKVVPRGEADGVFINTAGVGVFTGDQRLDMRRIKPGDKVVVNGTLGDHGISVLSARKGVEFETSLESDCAPLAGLVKRITDRKSESVKFMRDATRGGVATTLNEITEATGKDIVLNEKDIPVKEDVRSACELLGLDMLYLANEGKIIFVVDAKEAEEVVSIMKEHPYGSDAAVIGEIRDEANSKVYLKTPFGTERIVEVLTSEQLPRIC